MYRRSLINTRINSSMASYDRITVREVDERVYLEINEILKLRLFRTAVVGWRRDAMTAADRMIYKKGYDVLNKGINTTLRTPH